MLFLLLGCGAGTPETPVKEMREQEKLQDSPDSGITYLFGDAEAPPWQTRIKPGMSQVDLLTVWGKPWSAYKYPKSITSPERDVWCYYTLGSDFAIVSWSYDAKQWDAPAELSAAVWGKDSDEKLGDLGNVGIYGAINNNKYLTDDAEISRLFDYLYINYWKVKVI